MSERCPGVSRWREGVGVGAGHIYTQGSMQGARRADPARNGEASHADANGALDAAVKAKLDNYQHDYNERNFFFLPAVMTTSGRISGDFLRLLYILSNRHLFHLPSHALIHD